MLCNGQVLADAAEGVGDGRWTAPSQRFVKRHPLEAVVFDVEGDGCIGFYLGQINGPLRGTKIGRPEGDGEASFFAQFADGAGVEGFAGKASA